MSEYNIEWSREVLKYVCGISFLIVATCIFIVAISYEFNSPVVDGIAGGFLTSGVISGWMIVIIDFLRMDRGNEDDE